MFSISVLAAIGAVAGGGLMFNYKALYKMGPLTMKDMFGRSKFAYYLYFFHLTLFLLNPDMPSLCKQCRSRSAN